MWKSAAVVFWITEGLISSPRAQFQIPIATLELNYTSYEYWDKHIKLLIACNRQKLGDLYKVLLNFPWIKEFLLGTYSHSRVAS